MVRVLVLALALAAPAAAAEKGEAIFAGGCFWCMETAFEGVLGVTSVVSGYAGGSEPNPTYDAVSSGKTGHAEVVRVLYDPKQTTFARLLDLFWRNIDPLSAGGQFCDRGSQYRSAIFFLDDEQRAQAEASKVAVGKRLKSPIVTEVVKATAFFPAEAYHQDFYLKDPKRYQSYRTGCGRDRRLAELWGDSPARHH